MMHAARNSRRKKTLPGAVIVAACAAIVPALSRADSHLFSGASNTSWGTSSNWDFGSGHVPVNDDLAYILSFGSTPLNVNFSSIYSNSGLSVLDIDARNLGNVSLSQSAANSVMAAGQEYIGDSAGSTYFSSYLQSNGSNAAQQMYIGDTAGANGFYQLTAGTNTIGAFLNLGQNSGATGTYNLSGTGLLNVLANANEAVGFSGTGVFNQSGGTHMAYTLSVANNAGSVGTYTMTAGALAVASDFYVGAGGAGTFAQSGGSSVISNLWVGYNSQGTGSVVLSASGSMTAINEYVGHNGFGVFSQNGGSNIPGPGGLLELGSGTGSGTYILGGGVLSSGKLIVGAGTGAGSVFILNAGSATVTSGLVLAAGASSVGTFSMNGGNLSAGYLDVASAGTGLFNLNNGNLIAGSEFVSGAAGASANFNQASGSNNTGYLYIGSNSTSLGSYRMTNGLLSVSSLLSMAGGTFVQSGGTAALSNVSVGFSNTGNIAILGGTFSSSGDENIGTFLQSGTSSLSGTGTFSQSAGSHVVSGNLNIGAGGSGTYLMTGGTLSAATATLTIGKGRLLTQGNANFYSGIGTFNQSGSATVTVFNLNVGQNTTGTYTLNGGQAVASTAVIGGGSASTANSVGTFNLNTGSLSAANEYVGGYSAGASNSALLGSGQFNHVGGCNLISAGLNIGNGAGSFGNYQFSGGSLSIAGQMSIGTFGGAGLFNQTGGVVTSAPASTVSVGNGGFGTIQLSGLANFNTPSSILNVGYQGNGTFLILPGATGIFATVNVGTNGPGTVLANGGLLSASNLNIGTAGSDVASLQLSAGTVSASSITIGVNAGAAGITSVSAAGSLQVSNQLIIGHNGSGLLNINGGTINVANNVLIGNRAGAVGAVSISAGTFSALNMNLGATGSTASSASSSGSISMTGGTINVNELDVGIAGAGVVLQNGGTIHAQNLLLIGSTTQIGGSYNLLNGLLSAPALTINSGGSLTQNSGTIAATALTNNGVFTFAGGNMNGRLVNQGIFILSGSGVSFAPSDGIRNESAFSIGANQSVLVGGAGLTNNASITLAGGALGGSGMLINNSNISGYGTFNGSSVLVNNGGIAAAGGNMIISNAGGLLNNGTFVGSSGNVIVNNAGKIINNGNFSLSASGQMQLQNAANALTNSGTLNLNSGVINGLGSAFNGFSGVVAGPGSILCGFVNYGEVVGTPGTLNFSQPFTNIGSLRLTSNLAGFAGGTINNQGSIHGLGIVGNPVDNFGTIEAVGGILSIGGALANFPVGIIAASASNKVVVLSGLNNNLGSISLSGGTFDNNGHPLTNSGSIGGYGVFNTGGLTNAPGQNITFTGGLAIVNGPVTNSAGAILKADYTPVLFTGSVVNNGIIKVTGSPTNSVSFEGSYSGSGQYISDPASNFFQNVNVGPGGLVSGTVGDAFYISGSYTNSGTYTNAGGYLSAQNVTNNNALSQTAGTARMLALSGVGTTTVGGAGPTQFVVSGLSQTGVNINNNGTLTISPTANMTGTSISGTQFINTLAIASGTASGGVLDIGNHYVYVSRTGGATLTGLQRMIFNTGNLNGAANPLPGEYPDYTLRGGITSSVARSSASSYGFQYGIGAIDGAATDFLVAAGYRFGPLNNNGATASANWVGGSVFASHDPYAAIPTNRVLIAPMLYGDYNGDGIVNDTDLSLFVGLGAYDPAHVNGPQSGGWMIGDLNGDGFVDDTDLSIFVGSGNYNPGSKISRLNPAAIAAIHSHKSSVAKISNSANAASAVIAAKLAAWQPVAPLAAVSPLPGSQNETVTLRYDPTTGDLQVIYHGTNASPSEGVSSPANGSLQILGIMVSNGLVLTPGAARGETFNAVTYDSTTFRGTQFTGSIPDGYDLGEILPAGLNEQVLRSGLSIEYELKGNAFQQAGQLIVNTPEPASTALLAAGMVAVAVKRRHRKRASQHAG